MTILIIYKNDGTKQCEPDIKPRPLDDDKRFLEGIKVVIVGNGRHERLPIMINAMCGAPTGWANVFDIDGQRISRTQLFELSRNEFKIWHFATTSRADAVSTDSEHPFPLSLSIVANMLGHSHPDRLNEIIGHVVRVYKKGDPITDDYQANRLNLETDPQHRILGYWFG